MGRYYKRRFSGRKGKRRHYVNWSEYHANEREYISLKYGGADDEIRSVFFDLEEAQLASVLNAYEQKFGKEKRKYAEKKFPQWRDGMWKCLERLQSDC